MKIVIRKKNTTKQTSTPIPDDFTNADFSKFLRRLIEIDGYSPEDSCQLLPSLDDQPTEKDFRTIGEMLQIVEESVETPSDAGTSSSSAKPPLKDAKPLVSRVHSLLKAKARFTPNPERAIFLKGPLTSEFVTESIFAVEKFKVSSGDAPIAIYIDTEGGEMKAVHQMLNHLAVHELELMAVVPRRAYSAGAFLLTMSDYAIAYPQAELIYHGGRFNRVAEVTQEVADIMANNLREGKEQLSRRIAEKIYLRISHRLSDYTDLFKSDDFNKRMADDPLISEVEKKIGSSLLCRWLAFTKFGCSSRDYFNLWRKIISSLLRFYSVYSQSREIEAEVWEGRIGKQIREDARCHIRDNKDRSSSVSSNIDSLADDLIEERTFMKRDLPNLVAVMLNVIRLQKDTFETEERYSVDNDVMGSITEMYLEITAFMSPETTQAIYRGAYEYAGLFMEEGDLENAKKALKKRHESGDDNTPLTPEETEAEKQFFIIVRETAQPLYLFALSVAREIQTQDFTLTAEQAYMLGLIDEVYASKYKSLRSNLGSYVEETLKDLRSQYSEEEIQAAIAE